MLKVEVACVPPNIWSKAAINGFLISRKTEESQPTRQVHLLPTSTYLKQKGHITDITMTFSL